MIRLRDLSLRRGGELLLDGVQLDIPRAAKVGLVGRNGSGKTSLFSLLLGELTPDAGELTLASGLSISHVAQEVPALARPAIEYVIDGDTALRKVEAAIEDAQTHGDGAALGELHARFDALDGYPARSRAAQLLSGLGFAESTHEREVRRFSGGWRERLNLAQTLMRRSDLLLLDEPTNHLDLDAVLWLERWIGSYDGTLILIAHDREFLDNIVDYVAHLDRKKLQLFRGNYSSFERQHAENAARHQALYRKQQREIQRIRGFVDRFRAKATKARQAQSRLKALARMELVAAAHVDKCIRTCWGGWMCPNPIRSGRWTSRISPWPEALFIWQRWLIGTHVEYSRGGYRSRWTRRFVSRRLKRRSPIMGHRRSSTPTRVLNLPH